MGCHSGVGDGGIKPIPGGGKEGRRAFAGELRVAGESRVNTRTNRLRVTWCNYTIKDKSHRHLSRLTQLSLSARTDDADARGSQRSSASADPREEAALAGRKGMARRTLDAWNASPRNTAYAKTTPTLRPSPRLRAPTPRHLSSTRVRCSHVSPLTGFHTHTPSHAHPTCVVPVTPCLVSQVSRHGLEMHEVVGGGGEKKRRRKSKRPAPLRLRLLGSRVGADLPAVQEGACEVSCL